MDFKSSQERKKIKTGIRKCTEPLIPKRGNVIKLRAEEAQIGNLLFINEGRSVEILHVQMRQELVEFGSLCGMWETS